MMTLQFSEQPGPRERQLQRKYQNPLFPTVEFGQLEVDNARIADQLDAEGFLENFRDLVAEAINLPPNIDADDILKIKATLEQNYTHCAGLGGDMSVIRDGLLRLLEVIMQALIKAANGDAEAMQRIEQEMEMMGMHLQLSESTLFADLMHEEGIINEDEVIPTLLSASDADLQAALHLFNPEQLHAITSEANTILPQLDLTESEQQQIQQRLEIIERWLQEISASH